MNKLLTVFLVLSAFAVGVLAGRWGSTRSSRQIAVGSLSEMMAAQASATVRTLERIRDGNMAEAIELQESGLDRVLCALSETLPAAPRSLFDSMKLESIQKARDYRAKFPRTNSPEGVARAFKLLDAPTGR